MILSSVPVTLLLLKNNLIPLHQSLNFVQLLSNYSGSETIPFGISACTFSLVATNAVDIVVSVHLSLLEASFVIFNNPNLSDNTSISFILLELVLVRFCSLHYMYFVS